MLFHSSHNTRTHDIPGRHRLIPLPRNKRTLIRILTVTLVGPSHPHNRPERLSHNQLIVLLHIIEHLLEFDNLERVEGQPLGSHILLHPPQRLLDVDRGVEGEELGGALEPWVLAHVYGGVAPFAEGFTEVAVGVLGEIDEELVEEFDLFEVELAF